MAKSDDIDVLEKKVIESRLYNFNFAPRMSDEETIASVISFSSTATTSPTPPLTALTVGTPTIDGKVVQVRLADGEDGGKYYQVCRVLTSLGNKLQVEGFLLVREPH